MLTSYATIILEREGWATDSNVTHSRVMPWLLARQHRFSCLFPRLLSCRCHRLHLFTLPGQNEWGKKRRPDEDLNIPPHRLFDILAPQQIAMHPGEEEVQPLRLTHKHYHGSNNKTAANHGIFCAGSSRCAFLSVARFSGAFHPN